MGITVALYGRVSTGPSHGQDPELQLAELRDYANKRGWSIKEYADRGVSGTKASRPVLDQLMQAARRREFEVVAVWRFDRFARSVKHLVLALDEFQSLGISFVSLREALDFSTSIGRAMFTVIAAMSALERDLIVERVRAGVAKARSQGKRLGRPRKWTDEQREQATQLRAEGASWSATAKVVGLTVGTVRNALAVRLAEIPTTGAVGSPLLVTTEIGHSRPSTIR